MLRGSVEVLAAKLKRSQPLEVTTPTAVVGVRGTQYRVALDGDSGATRSEVLEGRSARIGAAQHRHRHPGRLRRGHRRERRSRAGRLLPAPDLTSMPGRFERPLVRFALPAEHRPCAMQVAQDETFERIVSDIRVPAGSDDAHRRAGRCALASARAPPRRPGHRGYDAARAFVLKARPSRSASNAPRSGGGSRSGRWSSSGRPTWAKTARAAGGARRTLQDIVVEREGVEGSTLTLDLGGPGIYHWRLASTRADGDKGRSATRNA